MGETRTKPFDSKLPGRYGRMTRAELSAESDRYDVDGVAEAEAKAFAGKTHPPHPKKRKVGRPAKAAGEKAERVLITIEPTLLRDADAFVRAIGETRAGWIQKLIRDALLGRGVARAKGNA